MCYSPILNPKGCNKKEVKLRNIREREEAEEVIGTCANSHNVAQSQ